MKMLSIQNNTFTQSNPNLTLSVTIQNLYSYLSQRDPTAPNAYIGLCVFNILCKPELYQNIYIKELDILEVEQIRNLMDPSIYQQEQYDNYIFSECIKHCVLKQLPTRTHLLITN